MITCRLTYSQAQSIVLSIEHRMMKKVKSILLLSLLLPLSLSLSLSLDCLDVACVCLANNGNICMPVFVICSLSHLCTTGMQNSMVRCLLDAQLGLVIDSLYWKIIGFIIDHVFFFFNLQSIIAFLAKWFEPKCEQSKNLLEDSRSVVVAGSSEYQHHIYKR